MIRDGRLVIGFALLSSLTAAMDAGGLTAVVAHVDGEVRVASPADPGTGSSARSLQVLAAGSVVNLGPGAQADLVCSSQHFVALVGPARWSLTAPGCAEGIELPLGTYGDVAPERGRLWGWAGARMVGLEVRVVASENQEQPIPLAPRGTNVMAERPFLRWRWSGAAGTYRFEIGDGARPVRIAAAMSSAGQTRRGIMRLSVQRACRPITPVCRLAVATGLRLS